LHRTRLFSIGTIVFPTSVWLDQLVKLITLTCLNLVEHVIEPIKHVFKSHVLFDIPIKPVFVQLIKIFIPPNTFQQHLPKTFFQLEIKEMEIDEMPT
jgi:hypothetical protein